MQPVIPFLSLMRPLSHSEFETPGLDPLTLVLRGSTSKKGTSLQAQNNDHWDLLVFELYDLKYGET